MKQKNFIISIALILWGFTITAQNIQINVDATKTVGELEPFWASQIVHPTEFLLTEWGENFLKLLNRTGAARQYIRIYNQPEEAIRISESGKITYDWSRFDKMAEMILSSGNKPHVVFFGMPYELAAYPDAVRKRPYGAVVCYSPPKDYRQWEEMCSDFTRHTIEKFGLEKVKQWTFRCWNEPDLGGFWYKADLPEYLKLYDYFAKAVKEVHPDIKIGGPGLSTTRTYKEPENFKFFLEHIVNGVNHATGEKGAPIDFLSVHTYGGTGGHGGIGREFPAVDYMIEQQIRYADMRDEYPSLKNLPINVEEWGVSASGTRGMDSEPMTVVRNSQYAAAFLTTLVECHIRMKQENDRNIAKFIFCSSGYEKIPKHDFMGYRTFDTKNGFHKPILNAYKLLDRLAPEIIPVEITSGNKDVSAFATKGDKRITIIITNYQNDKIHNDGRAYPVKVNVESQWDSEDFVTLKHWRIDKNHSNSYTTFKKIGSPKLPNPFDIDAVKEKMNLEMIESPGQKTMGELGDIEFYLPCNGISMIELIKEE